MLQKKQWLSPCGIEDKTFHRRSVFGVNYPGAKLSRGKRWITPFTRTRFLGRNFFVVQLASSLILYDMALDKQVDHTYAFHVTIPKERDHSYSTTRKSVKKSKSAYIQSVGDKGKDSEKWQSEENLTLDISSFNGLSVSGNDRKKSRSTDLESTSREKSDTCNSAVLSSSWPKENCLRPTRPICSSFNIVRWEGKKSMDHTYAKETMKQGCLVKQSTLPDAIPPEISSFERLSKLSITSDHAYSDKHKEYAIMAKAKQKPFTKFDHSYSADKSLFPCVVKQDCTSPSVELNYSKPSICSGSRDHTYLGSCESLDMQLSASDTDSCDEANENLHEITFTAWCQLRKDHPYSSF